MTFLIYLILGHGIQSATTCSSCRFQKSSKCFVFLLSDKSPFHFSYLINYLRLIYPWFIVDFFDSSLIFLIRHWFLVIRRWFSLIRHWFSLIRHWFSLIRHWFSVIRYWFVIDFQWFIVYFLWFISVYLVSLTNLRYCSHSFFSKMPNLRYSKTRNINSSCIKIFNLSSFYWINWYVDCCFKRLSFLSLLMNDMISFVYTFIRRHFFPTNMFLWNLQVLDSLFPLTFCFPASLWRKLSVKTGRDKRW